MIRLFHVYFPARMLALATSEAMVIVLALLTGTVVWFGVDAEIALLYDHGFAKIALASVICVLCIYYYDLYDSVIMTNPREVVVRLIQALGTVSVVLALLYYLYPVLQLPRGLFVLGITLTGLCVTGWRGLFLVVNRSARLAERAALVGSGSLATELFQEIEKRPELGMRLVGAIDELPSSFSGVYHLGNLDELSRVVDRNSISRLIITATERRGKLPVEELIDLKSRGIVVQDGAELYEAITGRVHLASLRPSWFLFSEGFRISRQMRILKRVGSIALSAFGLILLSPVMVVIALIIWLDSPGAAIFRQRRIGEYGKPFILYKFRSMVANADAEQVPRPASEDDSRFTRAGRYLRRTRLDELPQLYNILRGDMYFIGPRPFMPNMEQELAAAIPFYRHRWAIKPGATGWAQIHRGYCSSLEDNAEKLSYDLFYIKNMSLGLDCLIVFQTVKILLLGRGAR